MATKITKEKVTALLIKWGNNPLEVSKMVEKHFEYAVNNYSNIKNVCDCIRTIY